MLPGEYGQATKNQSSYIKGVTKGGRGGCKVWGKFREREEQGKMERGKGKERKERQKGKVEEKRRKERGKEDKKERKGISCKRKGGHEERWI